MAVKSSIFDIDWFLLQPNYFDLEFIDDVGQDGCVMCQRVVLQHHLANCSHKFCWSCARQLGGKSRETKCPKCQTLISKITSEFVGVEHWKRVLALKMCCPNKKNGCTYQNQLREVKEHLVKCGLKRKLAQTKEIEYLSNYFGAKRALKINKDFV